MAAFGSAPGIIVGAGVGAAASIALAPAFELPKQAAWAANPNRIFDLGTLARLVAIGAIPASAAVDEAARDGFTADKLAALVYGAQRVPPFGEALTMWRRQLITDELFGHVIVKEGFAREYVGALSALKLSEPNDPVQVANAIHRGIMADPGLLVHPLDLSPGNVDAYPVSDLDPLAEAASWGLSRERLRVLVGLQGLPMGSHEAAQAHFRGVLLRQDYNRAIAEGNTRNEWADAILEQSRSIPTERDYVEGYIRGWITEQEAMDGAARRGMQPDDTHLLQLIHGRAPAWRQVFIGGIRGGARRGPPVQPDTTWPEIPLEVLQALRESNIRPEWYGLVWANRFNYPQPFVLRALAQSGDVTQAETEQILLYEGWEPTLARKVSTKWASGGGGGADPYVKKAETQLWNTTHSSYVAMLATDQDATDRLDLLAIPAASQDVILRLWRSERELARKQLTATQVKKAYIEAVENAATGFAWTLEDARMRLVEMGYTFEDATTFLEE